MILENEEQSYLMEAPQICSIAEKTYQTPQTVLNLRELCFEKQLAFVEDDKLFAMAVTSRRAGKTTACSLHLLNTAIKNVKSVCLYVTLARTNAKKIIWPMLNEINREHELGGVPNESDLSLKFPNGSIIYVSGAATLSEIDRFRGLALKLVYVDEAQSFGTYLRQLIDDVLVPACFDNRGLIRLIGTPGPVPVGYYFDSYSSPGWSHHSWTMFDNPWILKKRGEEPHAILEQELIRRGVTEDDPTIQREIFGRFVVDTRKLVIEYNEAKNHYDALPRGTLKHILGIDIGYEDSDAIAVLAYSDSSPTTYLVDELITAKQGLTELCEQIEKLRKQYDPHKLMIDQGGLGLKLAEEMRRRFKIPVVGADKKRKFETIEMLNDSLRTGRLMAKKSSRFVSDSMLMEWDFDKTTPDKLVVSDRFHSDIIDAVLYAFKESPAYAWEPPIEKPKRGTPEFHKQEEDEMFNTDLEHFQNMEANDGFEDWV